MPRISAQNMFLLFSRKRMIREQYFHLLSELRSIFYSFLYSKVLAWGNPLGTIWRRKSMDTTKELQLSNGFRIKVGMPHGRRDEMSFGRNFRGARNRKKPMKGMTRKEGEEEEEKRKMRLMRFFY